MKRIQKPLLFLTALLIAAFACNFPPDSTPAPDDVPAPAEDTAAPADPGEEVPPGDESPEPPAEIPAPNVVTYNSGSFNIHSLDGTLVESRPAPGLESWSRPNQSAVVGPSIYYVDSGGDSLGGTVKRVTPGGMDSLGFTTAPDMATLTFAVSADNSKIAWAHGEWSNSSLWIADIDGANQSLIAQSAPDDPFEDNYVLEAVRFTNSGDLVYSWQISGIGNLFYFGYSTLMQYSPSTGAASELVPLAGGFSGPCWSTVSADGTRALGTCSSGGAPGMRIRELASGTETVFPVLPAEQQAGAASFSPDPDRIAYCFAERAADDSISGGVAVRLAAGEDPVVLANAPSGYFTGTLWATDSILLVEGASDGSIQVYQLTMAGALDPFVEGQLIGRMQPAP